MLKPAWLSRKRHPTYRYVGCRFLGIPAQVVAKRPKLGNGQFAGVVFHWRFRGQAVEVDTPSSKAAAVSEQVAENPKATNGETV